jgi:hypothetical protein
MVKKTQQHHADLAFGKENYYLMIAAIVVVVIGFLLMAGGKTHDPNVFNEDEIFSPRRITIAPIIVMIGYIIGIVSIIYKSKE